MKSERDRIGTGRNGMDGMDMMDSMDGMDGMDGREREGKSLEWKRGGRSS